jgi:signal transduction histidine kinase
MNSSIPAASNTLPQIAAPRGKLSAVLDILRYNLHFYAASFLMLLAIAALLWLRLLPRMVDAALIVVFAFVASWTLSSLLASYYIYDYAAVTRWNWLPSALPSPPRRWVNIHAGLDESSATLASFFPNSDSVILDIYDPREMTEPSIARARLAHPSPAIPAKLDALPLPGRDRDTVFLLFAAHEIRTPARRTQFFHETARVLAPAGQILLVEHLRNWKNFAAFGPGFLHFYPRSEWLRLARESGLTLQREAPLTPFVRYFLFTRPTP